jgi:hypothetical protein
MGFVADSSGEIKVRTHVMTQSKGALSVGASKAGAVQIDPRMNPL